MRTGCRARRRPTRFLHFLPPAPAAAAAAGLLCLVHSCGSHEVREPGSTGRPASGWRDVPWERVTVTGSVVNLRDGPGTWYAVIGTVGRGDTLVVMAEAGDWLNVYSVETSRFAWIYAGLTSPVPLPGDSTREVRPEGEPERDGPTT